MQTYTKGTSYTGESLNGIVKDEKLIRKAANLPQKQTFEVILYNSGM